ncbi:MAG: hypothetical protein D6719_07755 [Candidatus Dadabacteria bacterium]|nr:MAG: hypothetical protein D6719_07755 [Candidatus Dadabacteria bacterium]
MLERKTQLALLESLLKPVARFCLRHSQSIQDLVNTAKVVFVKVAEEEIRKTTDKVNVTRLSVMTGLYRNEVARIYRDGKDEPVGHESELSRVIGQWRHDPRFRTKAGKPRVLTFKGPDSEFAELVTSVSKNLKPGSIEFELRRLNYVEETPRGLKLKMEMPGLEGDPVKGFQIVSDDIDTLIKAVEENMLNRYEVSNLHIRTEYDNISKKDLKEIRQWFVERGKRFHREAREFLSKYDRDVNPEIPEDQAGARVAVGSFSLTTDPRELE